MEVVPHESSDRAYAPSIEGFVTPALPEVTDRA